MTKILIAESLRIETIRQIEKEAGDISFYPDGEFQDSAAIDGFHFVYSPDLTPQDLEGSALSGFDCLIVRPKEVSSLAIKNADALKLIVRGGAGLNSIDLAMAKQLGVVVENTPGQNSVSTAEYTFALIMEAVAKRNILLCDNQTRKGQNKPAEKYEGRELSGKKIGIVGLGSIGLQVASRCHAFGMVVEVFSRSRKDVSYKQHNSLESLLQSGLDILSLHCPLTEKTDKLISEKEFDLMGKSITLINAARPQLVDSKAFKYAIDSGILNSYAIDGDLDLVQPFIDADPNCRGIITNHIADSTAEAQEKITRQVIKQVVAFFKDGQVINAAP